MKTYLISFKFWVPEYNDFDYDEIICSAVNEADAITKFKEHYKTVNDWTINELTEA